jgi:hypothetical protein
VGKFIAKEKINKLQNKAKGISSSHRALNEVSMTLLAACLPFPSFNFAFYHCAVGKDPFLKNL